MDQKKKYLIIGGSSGIGLELAQKLSGLDHEVYATYFQNDQIESGANLHYHYLNVMDEEYDMSFLPEELDGIVYCPGSINLHPFKRLKEDKLINDFKLHVSGAIKCVQLALPALQNSEEASVVLFSTVAVQNGFNFHTQVSTVKGAIEGLTRSLAAELSPKIRVNAIAPSITDTPLASRLLNSEEKVAANSSRHPLRRIGQPKDLANTAAFLLSEDSSWITGQILHVDGGISSLKV